MATVEALHRLPHRHESDSDIDESSMRDSASIHSARRGVFDEDDAALIDNPLLHWQPADVETNVRRFAHTYGLVNQQDILIKGARILRDPEAWRAVPNLTLDETYALENEHSEHGSGFWHQPKELKITIITLCAAAVLQGWNQTASNGANLNWPEQFGLQVNCQPRERDAWIFAIVNAGTYLSASLIGCWLSDPLNEYFFGRRAAIAISAAIILASVVGGALTQTWRQLLACRILLGIGMGAKASVVPVFAAEVAPAHIRGSLVMNWQLFDAFGIFLGFSANLVAYTVGSTAWRWQTASSLLPCIVVLSLIWVVPESPRFLMKHGRYADAYKALLALRGEPVLAAKEILYTHHQMDIEMRKFSSKKVEDVEAYAFNRVNGESTPKRSLYARAMDTLSPPKASYSVNYWQKVGQLFTIPRIRRAMISAAIVMAAQQMCGVNILAFFSSTFFYHSCHSNDPSGRTKSGSGDLSPLLLSWGIGLSNFVFAFPAYWLIDRRGRRWLLLVTLPFLAVTLLASGMSFLIPEGNSARLPVVIFWIYIFMFFYSWGMGPVPFTMSAEVFPLEHRVVGMSFSVFVNLFGAGLLTLFEPILTLKLGHAGLLGIFAGLNVVAFFLVFFLVRETAGAALGGTPGSMTFLSLEELNYIFSVPTAKHAKYQLHRASWAWRYYVKRDPTCPDRPKKLYTWAVAGQAVQDIVETPEKKI